MFDVWQNVLAELEQVVSHEAYATWFSGAKLLANDDGMVKIGTPNVFKSTQLRTRFDGQIRKALEKNGVKVKSVVYVEYNESAVVKRRGREVPVETIKKKPRPENIVNEPVGPKGGTGLSTEYSLDNFVLGTNNDVAVGVAKNIIENPGGRFNPFFLYGGPGLGKTHLVQAIGNELVRKNPKIKLLYTPTNDFYSGFIKSLNSKQTDSFIRMYRNLDVLIIDDFQMIIGKHASQDAFFDVFNDLYQRKRQIIVTCDRLPEQIKDLDKRLSSRLAMTGPVDLQMPNFEDKCAILRLKAEYMGHEIEDEVIESIANSVKTNVRELEGELNRVLLYAEVRGITPIEVIRSGLIQTSQVVRRSSISPQKIVMKVAGEYGLTVEEMCGKSRVTKIKTARQVAMYLLQDELGLSTTKIALEVGVKDHTTVMHGAKKIRTEMTTDFDLRNKVETIRGKLYE